MPARCFNCKEVVDEEMFCSGCGEYICDTCEKVEVMGFNHEPSDHLGGL